jgi:hypothetical protein
LISELHRSQILQLTSVFRVREQRTNMLDLHKIQSSQELI